MNENLDNVDINPVDDDEHFKHLLKADGQLTLSKMREK